ncbi:MAG: porin family protein [Bacteroidales bacterium]|nr:porin family protein [Bacteroidales bacterium]
MRKTFLFIFLIITGFSTFAQKEIILNYQEVDYKKIHFGFTVGFNTMDFKLTPTMNTYGTDSSLLVPEINKLVPGFHVAIVSSLKLNEYFDLRFLPGISLGQRNILFYDENNQIDSEMKIESTFIDIPILIKYKATRINNTRPYLVGGLNIRRDMARNKEFNEDENIYIKLKPMDIYYEIGFGFDFYLAFFKLSTEIKYSVGTLNVVSSDASEDFPQYANAIEQLNSRMFMVSFHFE